MSTEEKNKAHSQLEACEEQLNELMEEYEKLLNDVYFILMPDG